MREIGFAKDLLLILQEIDGRLLGGLVEVDFIIFEKIDELISRCFEVVDSASIEFECLCMILTHLSSDCKSLSGFLLGEIGEEV